MYKNTSLLDGWMDVNTWLSLKTFLILIKIIVMKRKWKRYKIWLIKIEMKKEESHDVYIYR